MSNAKEVIQDWKQNKGFPYYPEDRKWRDDEFNKLTSFNRDTLLDTQNKIIGQSTHGLTLAWSYICLLYTSPSPRDGLLSRMPSSA